jgi:type IV secretion system protein VirD4
MLAGAWKSVLNVKFHDKFSSKSMTPGFTRSKYGTYGTAAWMDDKELKKVLEIKSPEQADGIILGERNGSVVCLPKDPRLNRHIAVLGASGTMKSRGVIRPALFTLIKRGEFGYHHRQQR